MTIEEARDIFRECGWSFLLRTRRGRKEYIYAARREQGQRKEKYISSLTSLEGLTVEALKAKLQCV